MLFWNWEEKHPSHSSQELSIVKGQLEAEEIQEVIMEKKDALWFFLVVHRQKEWKVSYWYWQI